VVRDKALRQRLWEFVQEGVDCLARLREWPRRILSAPRIYGDIELERELASLGSYKRLQSYLHRRGIYARLGNSGHTWIWHREVFEWLFLERVVKRAYDDKSLKRSFQVVHRRAEREIFGDYLTLRRIHVIHGLPKISRPTRIARGIRLVPFDLNSCGPLLYDALGIEFQSHDVDRWLHTDGVFLLHDRRVAKAGDGKPVLRAQDEMKRSESLVLLALRLAVPGTVHPGKSFQTQVSRFPLFPLQEYTNPDAERTWFVSTTALSRRERNRIQRAWRMLGPLATGADGIGSQRGSFWTALRRYYSSYRLSDHDDNILDLVVALEALYLVPEEELKRRLAMRVASFLGRTEKQRKDAYRIILGAYDIRNALVHGTGDPDKRIRKALVSAFAANPPEFHGKQGLEKGLFRTVLALRTYVRSSLWAYIRLEGLDGHIVPPPRWPRAEELDSLALDSPRRKELQRLSAMVPLHLE
jgi:hypothetical protein